MVATVCALVGAFLSATLCITVGPLREWTQELAVCRTADRVERDSSDGGDVRRPDGRAQATEVFEMTCFYDGGRSVKQVGNDQAVLGGIGVSVLIGLLAGGLPVLLRAPFRRRTS